MPLHDPQTEAERIAQFGAIRPAGSPLSEFLGRLRADLQRLGTTPEDLALNAVLLAMPVGRPAKAVSDLLTGIKHFADSTARPDLLASLFSREPAEFLAKSPLGSLKFFESGARQTAEWLGNSGVISTLHRLLDPRDPLRREAAEYVSAVSREGLPETVRLFRGGTPPAAEFFPVTKDLGTALDFAERRAFTTLPREGGAESFMRVRFIDPLGREHVMPVRPTYVFTVPRESVLADVNAVLGRYSPFKHEAEVYITNPGLHGVQTVLPFGRRGIEIEGALTTDEAKTLADTIARAALQRAGVRLP